MGRTAGPQRPLTIEGLCAFAAVCSFPRAAFAHGESLLGFFFWELMVVPWAVMVFVMARRRVFDRVARNRLGPSTAATTLLAMFGGWWGLAALADVIMDPAPLTPLLLAIAGVPAVWYLWRQGERRIAVTLLLIPVVLAGSCTAMTWAYP